MRSLSNREAEIIWYTARGYTSKEIAKLLGLQYRTIQAYIANIKKKFNARNVTHAVFLFSSSMNESLWEQS